MSSTRSAAPAPGTERHMRSDARRNYVALITTARAALAEHGVEASLEDIARRAGVGIGTLYRHFPSRLDLLEAVYRNDVETLARGAETLSESETEWDALEQWLALFIEYAATKRVLFHELFDAIGKDSELFTHSRQVVDVSVSKLLTRAQEAGVARRDVQPSDLLRLVGGCTMMPHLERDQQERMLRVVLAGLRL
ncbi:MAG: TetR/AcrR family transcriptional regulator [Streptosporangiaceae bacterium]